MERFANEVLFQIRILMDAWTAPFLAGITSRSYRSRASERVVFSASCRETKTPRTISDCVTLAQASASVLVSKVRVIRPIDFDLAVALHEPLLF